MKTNKPKDNMGAKIFHACGMSGRGSPHFSVGAESAGSFMVKYSSKEPAAAAAHTEVCATHPLLDFLFHYLMA